MTMTIQVNMKVKYMYSFLFQHIHKSVKGIVGVVLSIVALIAFFLQLPMPGEIQRKVILLILGLLFTVVNPILLWFKAASQVKLLPIYSKPLTYTFTTEGMTVEQGDAKQFLEWTGVWQVRMNKSILMIYTSANSASIIGLKELGEQRQEIVDFILSSCEAAGVKKLPKR